MPHPEGGYFRETYRSAERVRRAATDVERSASTAIYYLLTADTHSAWHRIRSDEAWHFYSGSRLDVHVIGIDGTLCTHRLGNALLRDDAVFQAVVPAGCWFAAQCVGGDEPGYALFGCTVAPGFEFSEFELADTATLQHAYPQHAALIARLGPRPPGVGHAVGK
jgi:predicted cupin superfamily sugar epimerase